MSKIKLKLLDSKNIYGTMSSENIRRTNITMSDARIIQDLYSLKGIDKELREEDEIIWLYPLADSYVGCVNFIGNPALRNVLFKNHRRSFAEAEKFDWHKMFMADQRKRNGSVFEITQDYVEDNPKGCTDIPEDILMMRNKLTGVALGYSSADSAVIVAEDRKRGITAIARCDGKMIDSKLPMMTIDALYWKGSSREDITVHVGARAGDGWVYTENRPEWATDEQVWDKTGAIVPGQIVKNGTMIDSYTIRQDNALAYEFAQAGIPDENIIWDNHNTIDDPRYYSDIAKSDGNFEKFGSQFIGAIYQEEGKSLIRK